MQPPNITWTAFRTAFAKRLAELDEQALRAVWEPLDTRTKYYSEHLMPGICRDLGGGLSHLPEFLCIDYAFCEPSANVPVVFVESENHPSGANDEEIPKLCSVSAPVRVLITCCNWSSDWPDGGRGGQLKSAWGETYRRRNAVLPIAGVFGVIVGEWMRPKSTFRVISFELNDANLEETVLLQRDLSEGPDGVVAAPLMP